MNLQDLAEKVGALADSADNYAHAAELPLPPEMHAKRLKEGMEKLRDKLRDLHIEATGNNPWE